MTVLKSAESIWFVIVSVRPDGSVESGLAFTVFVKMNGKDGTKKSDRFNPNTVVLHSIDYPVNPSWSGGEQSRKAKILSDISSEPID